MNPPHIEIVDNALLKKLTNLICKDLDSKTGQFYLWDFYSFKHIPVEVLSHIYQKFADRGKGAVFTPPMVVNLMLDQVMPLSVLRGDETILDPSCGSGIFLVSAFRRLVHAWCNANGWVRPTAKDLTELLSRTIFGIELQPQASELASFSLALAVCDALQPTVIWGQLRFDKLLSTNIFTGDYCDRIDEVKTKASSGAGFDIIVGNPPFMSTLTPSMQQRAHSSSIPDNQAAYFFLMDCATTALKHSGKICMLQNAGFLYNEKSSDFRRDFFSLVEVDCVLDFVSIRGLFKGADTKVVAVLATNNIVDNDKSISHLTFRRTFAADNLVGFDLDYYDYHIVSQKDAMEGSYFPWRANLLGGGRLLGLIKRLLKLPNLSAYLKNRGWQAQEGYTVGDKLAHVPWLKGKRLVTSRSFSENGDLILPGLLGAVEDEYFHSYGQEKNYDPPLLIIGENITLPCALWENSPLAYTNEFVGITASPNQATDLKSFAKRFIALRKNLIACIHLSGGRSLTTRATAVYKKDIISLPWPEDGNWELASWEEAMLDDVSSFMAEYVRLGQDSTLLKQAVNEENRQFFVSTYLKFIHHIFPDAFDAGHGSSDGLMYQAFSFRKNSPVEWPENDWAHYARTVLFSPQGDSESFYSTRVLRIYDGNTLILFKPDRLRYWICSIAIRDVDDTINDMMQGEEQDD